MACHLGLNKGIHTVIIAMTSCNDVIAIFLFSVLCSIVFSTDSLTHQLLQGPVGIIMGCVFGAASGFFVLHLPSPQSVNTNLFFFLYFPTLFSSLKCKICKKSETFNRFHSTLFCMNSLAETNIHFMLELRKHFFLR